MSIQSKLRDMMINFTIIGSSDKVSKNELYTLSPNQDKLTLPKFKKPQLKPISGKLNSLLQHKYSSLKFY